MHIPLKKTVYMVIWINEFTLFRNSLNVFPMVGKIPSFVNCLKIYVIYIRFFWGIYAIIYSLNLGIFSSSASRKHNIHNIFFIPFRLFNFFRRINNSSLAFGRTSAGIVWCFWGLCDTTCPLLVCVYSSDYEFCNWWLGEDIVFIFPREVKLHTLFGKNKVRQVIFWYFNFCKHL